MAAYEYVVFYGDVMKVKDDDYITVNILKFTKLCTLKRLGIMVCELPQCRFFFFFQCRFFKTNELEQKYEISLE